MIHHCSVILLILRRRYKIAVIFYSFISKSNTHFSKRIKRYTIKLKIFQIVNSSFYTLEYQTNILIQESTLYWGKTFITKDKNFYIIKVIIIFFYFFFYKEKTLDFDKKCLKQIFEILDGFLTVRPFIAILYKKSLEFLYLGAPAIDLHRSQVVLPQTQS